MCNGNGYAHYLHLGQLTLQYRGSFFSPHLTWAWLDQPDRKKHFLNQQPPPTSQQKKVARRKVIFNRTWSVYVQLMDTSPRHQFNADLFTVFTRQWCYVALCNIKLRNTPSILNKLIEWFQPVKAWRCLPSLCSDGAAPMKGRIENKNESTDNFTFALWNVSMTPCLGR